MVKRKYMQRWGCVYRLTNTLTGKVYIGKTVRFTDRMSEHKTKKLTSPISQAIQKYGWENFTKEILIDDVPEEDLKNLEDSYIEVEDTLVPNGYNVLKGGGRVIFNKQCQKWMVRGPNKEHIGQYFTEEKANEALKLYKETGERMESDRRTRKKGTGSIRKVGEHWQARIKRNSKNFDTPQQCEEWLTQTRDSSDKSSLN
jgi:group I intron endonuclease